MVHLFFGSIAFSLCLITFAIGAALTTWACNNCEKSKGLKFVGYFVIVFSVLSLILTTYNVASAEFMAREMNASMSTNSKHMMKKMKHAKEKANKNVKNGNGSSNPENKQ